MTIQTWVIDKLKKRGWDTCAIGGHGLLVTSPSSTQTVLAVAEPGEESFCREDLEQLSNAYENCKGVILIRRPATSEAFEYAIKHNLLLDSFGNIVRALESELEFSNFQHPDEKYLRSRIMHHRSVKKIDRIGLKAWRIERKPPLSALVIITQESYEFPVSSLRDLIKNHPDIDLDTFVCINPNTDKLSSQVVNAATEVGSKIFLLKDFLSNLSYDALP